ncbi:MAG: hypothetical protein QXX19_09360 [Candidatus Caldarchaeum sp.]
METTTFIGSPKVKIALVKAVKGYRWTVEVTHEDPEEALKILESVENELRSKYGTEQ